MPTSPSWPKHRASARMFTAMKAVLAPLLALTPERIAIKATTTEKLGAIGRKEGLAAFAIATVRLP